MVVLGHLVFVAGLGLYVMSLFRPAAPDGPIGAYFLGLSLALPMIILFPTILLGTVVNVTMLLSVLFWLQSAHRVRMRFACITLAAVAAAASSPLVVESIGSAYYLWLASVVVVSTAFWVTPDFNDEDGLSPLQRTFCAISKSQLLRRATHAD